MTISRRDVLMRVGAAGGAGAMLAAMNLLGLSPAHAYAYVPGLYDWGRSEAFLEGVPLAYGFDVQFPASRYVDINVEADWLLAERMYAEMHKVAA